MCGIFGFLSSRGRREPPAGDDFFRTLHTLVRFGEDADAARISALPDESRARILKTLEAAHAGTYAWMERDGFLATASDAELQRRLRDAAGSVSAWTSRLESIAAGTGFRSQGTREFLNRLITGGRDIAWQIENDLLASIEPVRNLVPAGDSRNGGTPLEHARQLHLLLCALDRLEVRGRDSAGLAAYLRFRDAAALDGFLDGEGFDRRQELERRSRLPSLSHGTLFRPASSDTSILAVLKVANEVGKMGDNAAYLRQAIATDPFLQAALGEPGVELQCLLHTRWASNGIISIPNCHPVDGAVRVKATGALRGRGEVLAVLNGDVDNYQELLERYVHGKGLALEPDITTDAKIIPVVVSHHYRETGDLREAFQKAFREFEGSMVIGVMAADHPGEMLFGQKGSGQGLFFGLTQGSVAIASEMYGLVELTQRYVKGEGERRDFGEVFHLRAGEDGVQLRTVDGEALGEVPASRQGMAEITTRDINRGPHPHFFRKEIGESVESVRKTLRGKIETVDGKARSLLGDDVLPRALLESLRSGRVRRIYLTGQGTAAVAAEGVAHFFEDALRRAKPAFQVMPIRATELSGHRLREDMSDTLVIAVSQSGTTTDTNRTVDMVKERGASILGIVNRRNSDLVYKSHGVLYTSDGRDIEMSVASTKAFYAQNVAGRVLALAIAREIGAIDEAEASRAIADLERLPEAMARTLELDAHVAKLASEHALRRRHWALVGSGPGKVAADEIRIKLSELCYKSIAIDFLEDKKHIDLSSEPLVLVCANGLPPATVSDVVKEVAIFKAHKALPIVITDAGESRFDPYAAGTIQVPTAGPALSFLLATMVGHLFGYHAAAAFDHHAERLRRLRREVLTAIGPETGGEQGALPAQVMADAVEIETLLASRGLDAGLSPGTAVQLSSALEALMGRLEPDVYVRHHGDLAGGVVASLSEAITELSRPIDAIKHQAKTVTVGISRAEVPLVEGPLLATFRSFGLPLDRLAESHRRLLESLEPLVASVEGATLYSVSRLDLLGRPVDGSTIRVIRKTGCADEILSRSEEERPLSGTKWGVVRRGEVHVGYGQTDGRKILIVPVIGERPDGHILLFHLELVPRGRLESRWRALRARADHLERLRIAVTERNLSWSEDLIEGIDNDTLFFDSPEAVAEAIVERVTG